MDVSHPVVMAIERHLASHPHAADSAEGVARWWLDALAPLPRQDEVAQALTLLVNLGRLRCRSLSDGTLLFSSEAGFTQ
jgi:hypothetical protein